MQQQLQRQRGTLGETFRSELLVTQRFMACGRFNMFEQVCTGSSPQIGDCKEFFARMFGDRVEELLELRGLAVAGFSNKLKQVPPGSSPRIEDCMDPLAIVFGEELVDQRCLAAA